MYRQLCHDVRWIQNARSVNLEDIESIINKQIGVTNPTTRTFTSGVFVNAAGERVVASNENPVEIEITYSSYTITNDEITLLRSLSTGNYWLATSSVRNIANYADYRIRYMINGSLSMQNIFNSDYSGSKNSGTYGVRAIIEI